MGTAMEKYLYFRTVADEDNDDGDTGSSGIAPTSIAIPARSIVGMAPSAAGTLTIWFNSVRNTMSDGDNEVVIKDSVVLNITTKLLTIVTGKPNCKCISCRRCHTYN